MAIGLGSNVGDRLANLRFGARWLADLLTDLRCSRVYETRPREVAEQPSFLNACCVGWTALEADDLMVALHEGERRGGRRRRARPRYGPRALDLDLLLYGERVIDRPGLRVPHPRLAERAFALLPLAEVAGDWPHPERHVPVRELVGAVEGQGVEAVRGVPLLEASRTAGARAPGEREPRGEAGGPIEGA